MVIRWLKRISASARARQFIARLALSYLAIVFVWMTILFFVGNVYIKKLMLQESIRNNHRSLATLTATIDGYVLGNLKDLADTLQKDCKTDPFVTKYMNAPWSGKIVDTLQVQGFLTSSLAGNPALESLSLYYPESTLLVTTSAILHPEKKGMFMSDLPASFQKMIDFDEPYRWVSDLNYPVTNDPIYQEQSGKYVPLRIPAIHFIYKIFAPGHNAQPGCYLFISLREDYLYDILRSRSEDGTDRMILIDQNGIVASAGNRQLIGRNLDDLKLTQLAAQAVSAEPVDEIYQDESQRALSLSLSPLTNWHYVVDVPVNRSSQINQVIFQMISATVLLATAVTVLFAYLSSRSLYRPVRGIARLCSQLYPQLVGQQNEVQLIASTIQNMESKLDNALQVHADSCPLVRLGVMRQLFDSKNASPVDLQEALLLMSFDMPYPDCCAWRIDQTAQAVEGVSPGAAAADQIRKQIDQTYNTSLTTCLTSTDGAVVFVLFNFSRAFFDPYEAARDYAHILVRTRAFTTWNLSCGPVVLLEDAQQSAQLSTRTAAYHWLYPERMLITYFDILKREQTAAILVLEPHLKSLDLAMKSMDPEEVLDAFDQLTESVRITPCTIEQVRQAYQIVAHTLHAALQLTLAAEHQSVIAQLDDLFRTSRTIQEIRDGLPELLQNIAQIRQDQILARDHQLILKAQAYIRKNISSTQLSLQDVADDLGISASHFSRMFKRETGIVFLDYVNDLRLQICSQMLLNTNQKIAQIASALGYSTPQYLASRFKIKYGCTPKEYRLQNRSRLD